jgi:hypothetical protein
MGRTSSRPRGTPRVGFSRATPSRMAWRNTEESTLRLRLMVAAFFPAFTRRETNLSTSATVMRWSSKSPKKGRRMLSATSAQVPQLVSVRRVRRDSFRRGR